MKLYLDPGHGGSDPGAVGNGLREKDITLDIALHIRSILISEYENVEVRMSRTSDVTRSLSQRTNDANAWGADFFLSIHCNASSGSARGYEDYIYSSLSDSSRTARLREIIHGEVIKHNQLPNRGKKKANFHVLRETRMDALLTENGFIDHVQDAALMRQSSWRQKVALGHANGIAKAFNLKGKQQSAPGTVYRVIAGSFLSRERADERVAFLSTKGIQSFVHSAFVGGVVWYRVQAGAFSTRENAEQQLERVKKAGISDAYILNEAASQTPPHTTGGYSILGETYLSAEHMNRFVKKVNPNAPELGSYYAELGEYYGIRGDVAFAQAMHETNFLRFTGTVNHEQNNYAGIGTTDPNTPGATFATRKEGVLAHLQHLYAYATTEPLPNHYPLVDPRFNLVSRGIAPTWVDLNGRWAVPGTTYGQLILDIYERMVTDAIQHLETVIEDIKTDSR